MDIVKTIKSNSGIKAEEYESAIKKYWQLIDEHIIDQTNLLLMSHFEPDNDIKSNFLELKSLKKIYGDDILTILNAYFEYKQENDIEIIVKFKDTFDFKKHELLYFIDREIILKEMNRINRTSDVRVNPISFFKLVEFHFQYKIINLVFLHFKIEAKKKSGKNYNGLHNLAFDIFRNYKNAMSGNSSQGTFEKYLKIESNLGEMKLPEQTIKESWQMILDETRGKTEKSILKELVDNVFYYKCSKNKFYQEIFPLFKIILPDHSLLSEDEFLNNSLQSQSFNAEYKGYQSNKIQKIITSKS